MSAEQIVASLAAARGKLAAPVRRPPSATRALAAAAFAAVSALTLFAAVILGPGFEAKDNAPPTIFGER